MTRFADKSFSVAVSSGQRRLVPGTKRWREHVVCDGPDCPKCRPAGREPLIVEVPTLLSRMFGKKGK